RRRANTAAGRSAGSPRRRASPRVRRRRLAPAGGGVVAPPGARARRPAAQGGGGLWPRSGAPLAEAIRALTIMRRGHGSLYDIVVPGYKANLSDVLASIAPCQLEQVERHPGAQL